MHQEMEKTEKKLKQNRILAFGMIMHLVGREFYIRWILVHRHYTLAEVGSEYGVVDLCCGY